MCRKLENYIIEKLARKPVSEGKMSERSRKFPAMSVQECSVGGRAEEPGVPINRRPQGKHSPYNGVV